MDYFNHELLRTGVTPKLLWEKYFGSYPEGYGYTKFCDHFNRHLKCAKATMHFYHLAGDRLLVDFVGKQWHYIDIQTGEMVYALCWSVPCRLATIHMSRLCQLLGRNICFVPQNVALTFFWGVPRNILSDKMK